MLGELEGGLSAITKKQRGKLMNWTVGSTSANVPRNEWVRRVCNRMRSMKSGAKGVCRDAAVGKERVVVIGYKRRGRLR